MTKRDVQRVPEDQYRIVAHSEVSAKLNQEMLDVLTEDAEASAHGIYCIEYKVLVRPKKAETVTKGGIALPDMVVEKDQHAAMEGVICGMSPLAFSYEEWPATARKPQMGDTVVFARYSGISQRGNDGVEYRIMNDRDIVAVRRPA